MVVESFIANVKLDLDRDAIPEAKKLYGQMIVYQERQKQLIIELQKLPSRKEDLAKAMNGFDQWEKGCKQAEALFAEKGEKV